MQDTSMYTILIVDDNSNNLFTLRTLLETSLEAKVLEANSGAVALGLILQEKIDLILLDVQMPEMDGFEVARLIRSRKKSQDIPIIFLTAVYKSEQFREKGLETGAIDYLTKPIDDTILLSRIKAYLRLLENERVFNRELERMNAQLQQEIDERKRAEQALRRSEKRSQALLNATTDQAVLLHPNGTILAINDTMAAFLGKSVKDVIGTSLDQHFPPEIAATRRGYMRTVCQSGQLLRQEDAYTGQIFDHSIYPVFNDQGRIESLAIFSRDITIQRHFKEKLLQQTAEQEALLSTIPAAVYYKDIHCRYITANQTFCDMTHASPEEISGKTDADFFPPDYAAVYHQDDQEVLQSGQAKLHIEEQMPTASGSTIWVSTSKTPYVNADGDLIGLVGISLDISRRKMAEKTLQATNQKLLDIIEFLPDATFVIDQEGKVIAWNRAIEELTGLNKENILGKGDHAYAVPFYGKPRPMLIDMVMNPQLEIAHCYDVFEQRGKMIYGESFVSKLHGNKGAYMWWMASPLLDGQGNLIGAIESARDITERKQLQEKLEQANQQLQKASNHKSAFLAGMSHELRTPLNAMIGYTSLTLNALKDSLPSKHLENLKKAERSARTLLNLINDVLDFSKIEAGKMDIFLEEIEVADILEDLLITAEGLLLDKPVKLHAEIAPNLPNIQSDYTKIKQILNNLISNAIKFTSEGHVIVRAFFEEHQARIRIEIEDTGPGIAKDQLESIFESFRQADNSTTRKFGGTGLGLSITRRLCDMLHIELGVHSEIEKGTTFWLHFSPNQTASTPQKLDDASSEEENTADDASDARSTYQSVLVIDDEDLNIDLFQEIFQESGHAVYTAKSGQEGIKLAQQFTPDVILVDLTMPEMDGFETTRLLKQHPETRSIPVIACSALVTKDAQTKALEAGCTGYISKPIRPERLAQQVAKIVADAQKTV